jgi:mRNA-degrading endonuclease RelE of RelBE toxin-antitoxin system
MAHRPKYAVLFAPETVAHMHAIEAKFHGLIERTINQQLQHTPDKPTRNRKPLVEPGPNSSTWELRFGPQNCFRVFYDVVVGAREVHVLAIGIKDRNRLLIGGREYKG